MGRWIGEKLNACAGEIRFLIPEGGVSALDAPGQAFWDPEALAAFVSALEATWQPTEKQSLIKTPYNINDPRFADTAVLHFREISHSF
jgi:uncharacterized protein (UPF0261 family)